MGLHELADLLLRWVHIIAGIMWIGNSLLFNWLDRNLVKPPGSEAREGFEGEIWLLHSGGFYQVEKKQLAPHELPPTLHWFKWQNGFTWMSGICLLIVVYYLNDGAFLLDPSVSGVSREVATWMGMGLLIGGWLVYDSLWRALEGHRRVAAALSLTLLGLIIFVLTHVLSGRAAFIHAGVLLGTLMTGNVWLRILPSQHELVAATEAGKKQDKALSLRAKTRSIHNNYMTFPLLFIMISNHFPSAYANPRRSWLILAVLMLGGAGVRHFMNIRFTFRHWLAPAVGIASLAIAGVLLLGISPARSRAAGPPVAFASAHEVIARRCLPCHSQHPTESMFPAAPNGVKMDTPAQIRALAPRIYERAVVQRTMPFTNKTGMTDEERDLLGRWVDQGAAE